MNAAALLTLCASRGLCLSPAGDGVRVVGPKDARAELREPIRQHKVELVSLLRAGRVAEVSAFYSQAFGRLGALYPDSMIGNLWPAIVAQHPALAHVVDVAEQAADTAALAYQSGTAVDSSQFLACLKTWETAWAEAIEAITGDVCSDCGKRSIVLVGVDYSAAKFCRACLRPEPLNTRKGARRDA